MDAPPGSVEPEETDELGRLRQRAYGPDADIARDSAAKARLSELEAAQRRQVTPVVDAAGRVPAPVPERVPVPEPVEGPRSAQEDGQAPGGAANPSPPAGLATKPRVPNNGRVRRIPWAIAAFAVLVAAIAIGILVISESSEPRPVARLTAQAGTSQGAVPIDEETARTWGVIEDDDFVSYGSYGAVEIWSTTPGKRCLTAVVDGRTLWFFCTAPTIDTIIDIDLDSRRFPPAPSGEPTSNIRFVLHDDVVDVYLAPNPEGGFY